MSLITEHKQILLHFRVIQNPELIKMNLIAGGANNPFLEDVAYDAAGARVEDQGQYYGRGYSQAQSGYSSSGFGTSSIKHAINRLLRHTFYLFSTILAIKLYAKQI